MDEKFICLLYFVFLIIYTSISNGQAVDFPPKKEEEKHEYRRVENDCEIIYKKIPTNQMMSSIQLAIQNTMKNDTNLSEPDRDLLMPDFVTIEAVVYPKKGSQNTPSHKFHEFTFKTYAPIIFHRFRYFYGIKPNEYIKSICFFPLRELSNSGGHGSLFYITHDDKFIMKTVQWSESRTLQELLYAYYLNLKENPNTLLPKFFGLYRYQSNSIDMSMQYPINKIENIRLVTMNNLLPSNIQIHEKYDLKGSTYKRKASKEELLKSSPTFKDLDFKKNHPDSIYLKPDTYATLFNVLQNDCKVLESIRVLNYSLLMGVHYVDRVENKGKNQSEAQLPNAVEKHASPLRGIEAISGRGERLLLFVGIIDVLQSYGNKKRAKHDFKVTVHDADSVYVHRFDIYASRFLNFMAKKVFKIYVDSANKSLQKFEESSLIQNTYFPGQLLINRVNTSSEGDTSVETEDDLQSEEEGRKLENKRVDFEETSTEEEMSGEKKVDLQSKEKLEDIERKQVDNKEASTQEQISFEAKVDLQSKENVRNIERKRVDNENENTDDEIYSDQIMGSIQLGIKHAIEYLVFEPDQNLRVTDFEKNIEISFPRDNYDYNSRNHHPNFTFTSYDPIIFHRIRSVHKIKPEEYVKSICSLPLQELSNPGASGSIFYKTGDDKYFIKTVQEQESTFLQKLLLGYYLNLDQNENTLLPKLYGHYRYQCNVNSYLKTLNPKRNRRNMTLLVMNNLLPSNIEIHEKYDLKGSTSKRNASHSEKLKNKPTFKDLDFFEKHPRGFFLEPDAYTQLMNTLQSDCRVLESFKIMDYSLLMGVHYVNRNQKTQKEQIFQGPHNEEKYGLYKKGIPAKSGDGRDLLLFVGIIDILQDYRLKKKLEHKFKSTIEDGNTISVHKPDYYANRFMDFMNRYVFKKKLRSRNGRTTLGDVLRENHD